MVLVWRVSITTCPREAAMDFLGFGDLVICNIFGVYHLWLKGYYFTAPWVSYSSPKKGTYIMTGQPTPPNVPPPEIRPY